MVTRYLLDTNQVSKFLDGHPAVVERVARVGLDKIAMSPIVCGELSFMVFRSINVDHNLKKLKQFLEQIHVLPLDLETVLLFGNLKQKFFEFYGPKAIAKRTRIKPENLGLSHHDLWIASAAIRYQLTLVTADSDFTRIQQIHDFKIESWWSPNLIA